MQPSLLLTMHVQAVPCSPCARCTPAPCAHVMRWWDSHPLTGDLQIAISQLHPVCCHHAFAGRGLDETALVETRSDGAAAARSPLPCAMHLLHDLAVVWSGIRCFYEWLELNTVETDRFCHSHNQA